MTHHNVATGGLKGNVAYNFCFNPQSPPPLPRQHNFTL